MTAAARDRFEQMKGRLRLPVIAAPMFLVSGLELVQAARGAGVIGSFPFPNCRTLEQLESWLDSICGAPEGLPPFAANMITHSTYDRLEGELALVRRYRPEMVITALGGPRPVIDTVHDYGGLVLADVNSVPYARKAVEAGADGLVLVSAGAGGHTGNMSPFAFVSAVREFFDGIVVLAGSIATGRAVRAAEMLGADLAYIGTGFIAARESLAPDPYRQMLAEAAYEDLVASSAFTGAEANYLRQSLEAAGYDPAQIRAGRKPDFGDTQASIKAWRDLWSAGHAVGLVRDSRPASEIVDRLVAEYRDACATMPWPSAIPVSP